MVTTPGSHGEAKEMVEYKFPPGLERIYWEAEAARQLPETMDAFGYERAIIYSSRTLRRSTKAVQEIAESLGNRLVGVSDEVGEHAPISNVVRAIRRVSDARADVIVCIGGGSVTDFGKFVQLGVTLEVDTREDLLDWKQLRQEGRPDPLQPPESFGPMKIRQIAIPTTFSTGALTYGGTPIDDVTGAKVGFLVRDGSPRAVIYDPDLVEHTPSALLASTGMRSFDHAINNVIAMRPNPLGCELSSRAISLYQEHLPLAVANNRNAPAISQCQLATCLTALGNMGARHGFSHYSVHVLGPWAGVGHGVAACVMLLAQARWFCEVPDEAMDRVAALLGRPDQTFDTIVLDLLRSMDLPTSLAQLGVHRSQIEELAALMMAHPAVTQNNRRPITSKEEIVAILNFVMV